MALHLSDDELIEITRRKMHTAQARVLAGMGVPYRVRPDGSLLVGRAALEQALCSPSAAQKQASGSFSGINWTRPA